jgi:hypothetical protein
VSLSRFNSRRNLIRNVSHHPRGCRGIGHTFEVETLYIYIAIILQNKNPPDYINMQLLLINKKPKKLGFRQGVIPQELCSIPKNCP